MHFHQTTDTSERIHMMTQFAQQFAERAGELDSDGKFPMADIKDLKRTGYTSLTVPQKYGGLEISLLEFVQLQEQIAIGNGSTALSIGWHMGIIMDLGTTERWEAEVFQQLCAEVMKGALINSAATEPATGSPTRGGRPQTTAVQRGDQWVISGRKTFTTMAPALDYVIVSAYVQEKDQTANFLIPFTAEGMRVEETWNSLSMRSTGSHDLILEQVMVPKENLVEWIKPGARKANGWLLHIPACYLGIAQAAQTYAIQFAQQYTPNSIKGPIIEAPAVRQKIGETELELIKSRQFLHAVARQWDEGDQQERAKMAPQLGAVKYVITNTAIHVVDLSMRIVGAGSLSMDGPMQRYYRDVRAGLHNPPMDDMTVQLLADHAVERVNHNTVHGA